MKKTVYAVLIGVLTGVSCIAGAFLRQYQLARCMDEAGLLARGSSMGYVLAAFVAVVLGLLAILCSRLNRLPGTERCFSPAAGYLVPTAVGAGAMLLGCALGLFSEELPGLYLAGAVAAILLLVAAFLRYFGKNVNFLLLLLPSLFLVVKLFLDFKGWSYDPAVIDFCFLLLASICTLLSVVNLTAFCFGVGKRRATVFWCMAAGIFTAMTLPDFLHAGSARMGELLVYGGLGVWCVSSGLQLLRGCVQNEQPAPEPETPPEEAPDGDGEQ